MNGRIVLLQPYVPEGIQIIIEGPTEMIGLMADAALVAANVFWAARMSRADGVPSGPKLVA